MYFKCVLLGVLFVLVGGSHRRTRPQEKPDPQPSITEVELQTNRENLEKFDTLKQCSDVFAIAVAGAVSAVQRGTFEKKLSETLAMDDNALTALYGTLPAGSTATSEVTPNFAICAPINAHMEFVSMDQGPAQLIATSIERLLSQKKLEKTRKKSDSTMEMVRVSLDAILNSFTGDQLKVLNAMAELRNPELGKPASEPATDVASLFKEIHNLNIVDNAFGEGNYLVPIYIQLRRLKIATGGDIRKDLFHATDKGLPSKLGPILGKLQKSAEPVAPQSTIVASPIHKPGQELDGRVANIESTVHDPYLDSAPAHKSGTDSKLEDQPTSPTIPSTNLDSQTTIISSIATQEKIFFTNFHNAAQQLSLLGIKAVGLATQIQAIRGHMMMLKLIDQHIVQLNDDHGKYSRLLEAALKQLETVTEFMPTPPS
jgi:hypothetical protein